MTNATLVEFQPSHLEKLVPRECHDGEVVHGINGSALTLMYGDEPVAILVYYTHITNVLQVSAILSDRVKEKPLTFHKTIKHLLDYAMDGTGVQRIQMSVKTGYDVGWHWARSLGFQCEGIMKKYGPNGSDYWMFARTA